MAVIGVNRSMLMLTGRVINDVLSFFVFTVLDVLDFILCYVYKVADFVVEAEWKSCYCGGSAANAAVASTSGNILVSEQGESSKVVCFTTSKNKIHLEEISDTLYRRPSFVSDVSKLIADDLDVEDTVIKRSRSRPKFKIVDPNVVEMLQAKFRRGLQSSPSTRWSDCDCPTCASWAKSCKDLLYVQVDGVKDNTQEEDVIFIHGFISSSAFWTETVFPEFSKSTKSMYRLIAVDLLGFGRSPKPTDSLYTLREHLEMIERSVLEPFQVKSFHIVAHSLGCILALALAVKYPGSVKSLTLLAPPYFAVPKGEDATQHQMRKLAPRRVWPPMALASSLACWYEHVSRTICLTICKNHRIWEFLTKLITRNRIKTFLIDGFCCHTHNAAWHTLHNILCGTPGKVDQYLEIVANRLDCNVNIFHGRNDEVIPVECSYNVQSKISRANVNVVEKKDHITIVVGRQKEFASELEKIWKS